MATTQSPPTTPKTIYIPTGSFNLKDAKYRQIRLALQGASGTGKTYSALTFPNPVVLDFDNGLTAHKGKEIVVIPFHSAEWVNQYNKGIYSTRVPNREPNRRDALMDFLTTEGPKFSEEQTLILDSSTTLQNAWHTQSGYEQRIAVTSGKDNKYAYWNELIAWFVKLHTVLMSLKCNFVVIWHETFVRDQDTQSLTNKLAPLMQGKFVAQVKLYYTDWFRCVATSKFKTKPSGENEKDEAGFPIVIGTTYSWQIKSTNECDCKTRMTRPEVHIKPTYESFTY